MPQEATSKITIEKLDQEQISEAYPEMSLRSPTDRQTDRPTVKAQRGKSPVSY